MQSHLLFKNPASLRSCGFDTALGCVQGAVIWYGVFDFAQLNPPAVPGASGVTAPPPNPYLGCGDGSCSEERLRAPSPVNYVDENDPPILIMHGAEDKTVPLAQSQEFYEVLRTKHVKTELIVIPDVDHSFLGKTQAFAVMPAGWHYSERWILSMRRSVTRQQSS